MINVKTVFARARAPFFIHISFNVIKQSIFTPEVIKNGFFYGTDNKNITKLPAALRKK